MTDQKRAEAETLFYRGSHCMEAGDSAGAETCFREAVRIDPEFAEAYANLGLLSEGRDVVAAEQYYWRSIELNPAYPQTHLNLGVLLANQKRFAEAELAYSQAIVLAPDSPAGWSNLGVLYACSKREEEAEQCYRNAIALDASYRNAQYNLSYLLLRQGRFDEGWQCLQARPWLPELAKHLSCPRWQGESLSGKSVLIVYEAGHGDMIQFGRYAAVLKARGAQAVTLVCHPALKTLFGGLDGVDAIFALDEQVPVAGYDYWTMPMSIPSYCDTRLDTLPARIPYLQAPKKSIEKWAALLPRGKRRVGLVWKGNPRFENDADRSLPSLDVLAPLWAVTGIDFISLQKGSGEEEAMRPPSGMPLVHIGSQLEDFADAAGAVMNLDLVICVDTAMAHLAGALGKPCWVLLSDYKTDWRWLKDRTDSPWYPGKMRLFRQRLLGEWGPAIAEMTEALKQMER